MKKSVLRFATGLMLSMFTLLTTPSWAQAKGYVGVLGGMSVPDADDTSSRPVFGIIGGARLDGEFGLGGYFLSSSKEESNGAADFDFNYDLYGIEGSFHFEGVAEGAFVAVRAGISKVKLGNTNYSPMSYGILFGYDHFLAENFSLGLEAGWMRVEGEKKTGAADLDSFSALNFAAALKFWL